MELSAKYDEIQTQIEADESDFTSVSDRVQTCLLYTSELSEEEPLTKWKLCVILCYNGTRSWGRRLYDNFNKHEFTHAVARPCFMKIFYLLLRQNKYSICRHLLTEAKRFVKIGTKIVKIVFNFYQRPQKIENLCRFPGIV